MARVTMATTTARATVTAMACAALCACGEDAPPQGVVRSGDRVRAVYLVDDAGGRTLRGWFDREVGAPCTWTVGRYPRCVPAFVETNMYADPDCTQPVLALDLALPCERPAYLAVTTHDACGEPAVVDVWTVSDELLREPSIYRTDGQQPCRAESVLEGVEYHRAARRVAAGELVGGRIVRAGGGRIQTRTLVADDGALVPLDAYDRELEEACRPVVDEGCAPRSTVASHAEDEMCARPVAMESLACPSRYVSTFDGERWRYFGRGALLSDDPARELALFAIDTAPDAGTCAPTTVAPWEGFGLYRAALPIELVAVERRAVPGPFVDADWLVAGNHRQLERLRLTGTDLECTPTQVAPGAWRCLPSLSIAMRDGVYADDRCSIPIGVAIELAGQTAADLPAREPQPLEACEPRTRLYEQGAARTPGTTFVRAADVCVPAPTEWMGFELRYRDLGPETSLDRFPRLTWTID